MQQPIIFQRIEGMVIFFVSLILFLWLGDAWWIFIALLFSFDISLIGYLANKKTGALLYNIGHSLFLPAGLMVYALILNQKTALAFALIWLAHIGFDRMLGYGLKFSSGFTDTHLGKIGRKRE